MGLPAFWAIFSKKTYLVTLLQTRNVMFATENFTKENESNPLIGGSTG
jgi:hypothetical protein